MSVLTEVTAVDDEFVIEYGLTPGKRYGVIEMEDSLNPQKPIENMPVLRSDEPGNIGTIGEFYVVINTDEGYETGFGSGFFKEGLRTKI